MPVQTLLSVSMADFGVWKNSGMKCVTQKSDVRSVQSVASMQAAFPLCIATEVCTDTDQHYCTDIAERHRYDLH